MQLNLQEHDSVPSWSLVQRNFDRTGTERAVDGIAPFRAAGFALHWLHPRSKRPIGERWSEAPVASLDDLLATYRPGNNIGVRLGEPSKVEGGYLHVLDLDIRDPEQADDAWAAVEDLLQGVNIDALPCVASGSGGESRHLYLVTEKPFRSKRLACSEGKMRGKDGKWHLCWEVELFGTGKQVAMPPSIHPDTLKSYVWERPLDFDLLDLGFSCAPIIPADLLSGLVAVHDTEFAYESRPPLTFKPGQLEAELSEIPISDLHYDDWIALGQALHHQFGGSQEGFDLWLKYTRTSAKFTGENQVREMRRIKWPSFGRYRGKPVTMATVRQWVLDARRESFLAEFDEVDDFQPAPEPAKTRTDAGDFSDFLGDPEPRPATPSDDILDLLGDPDPEPAADDIDNIGTPGNETRSQDWISLLDLNEEGGIRPNLHNIKLIVSNDPRSKGIPQFNLFTQESVQRRKPQPKADHRRNAAKSAMQLQPEIWQVTDPLNGSLWSDHRDYDLRKVFEAPKTQGGYGIKISDRDLQAAIAVEANNNSFHPVREYLETLEWDGKARAERLFIDYLGADDNAYTRSIARLMLIAAVTRIYEPGHKFDYSVIIEGLQGKGKSTFIQILGKSWFGELDGDFHDAKGMVELMQGKWIMEIPELSGFNRGDVRTIKAFISRQEDRARLAYARRAGNFPRQCIFIGSTNDREYLKDDTGGRRWWPVYCSADEIDTNALLRDVDQIWAEAMHLHREMRAAQPTGTLPLYLTDQEARTIAVAAQEARRVESADDGLLGQVHAWLDMPINSGGMDDDDGQVRNETCLLEIWCECLNGDRRQYDQKQAQALGRVMARLSDEWVGGGLRRTRRYGPQRVYVRKASLTE